MSGEAPCDLEALEALASGELAPARAEMVVAHARSCPACEAELAWLRQERALMDERARREPPLPPGMWAAVQRRISEAKDEPPAAGLPVGEAAAAGPGRERRGLPRGRPMALAVGAGAAAALMLALAVVLAPGERGTSGGVRGVVAQRGTPAAAATRDAGAAARGEVDPVGTVAATGQVLDSAEEEYRQAIAVLERELTRARARVPAAVARHWDDQFRLARAQVADARSAAGGDLEARLSVLDGYAAYMRSLQAVVLDLEDGREGRR